MTEPTNAAVKAANARANQLGKDLKALDVEMRAAIASAGPKSAEVDALFARLKAIQEELVTNIRELVAIRPT